MQDAITNYGVYAIGENGYIEMSEFNNDHLDFKLLDGMPFVNRTDDKVEMVIYQENFDANNFTFGLRKLAFKASNEKINVKISPLGKENMYNVTVDEPVSDDHFLIVQQVVGWNGNVKVMFLGDPQKELERIFSDMEQKPVYAVLPTLEDCIKIFPENEKLKSLLPAWQQAEKDEKDLTDYKYVDEAWQEYLKTEEDADSARVRIMRLEKAEREINGYLANHENGVKAEQCKEYQGIIDTKLPEYEALV